VLSAHGRANVADSLAAEGLFQFSQDFSLANFFGVVMHDDWRIPAYAELGQQGRGAEREAKKIQFGEQMECN
jgi:hypothetical protein